MNLGLYQKEVTLALAEVVTFGTAVTPLLLTVQSSYRPLATAVTVILGVLGVAKVAYTTLTGASTKAHADEPPHPVP